MSPPDPSPAVVDGPSLPILSRREKDALDAGATTELGLPTLVLMENAGRRLAELAAGEHAIWILGGPGNNGADGLVAARHLLACGTRPQVVLWFPRTDPGPAAAVQLQALRAAGLEPVIVAETAALAAHCARMPAGCCLIDALFGSGLNRPLDDAWTALLQGLRERAGRVIAADLPSGLSGDRGDLPGPHLPADVTLAYGALMPAHVLEPARSRVGHLCFEGLGLPAQWRRRFGGPIFETLAVEWFRPALRRREAADHKHRLGHLLVWAGGPGTVGAAVLTARAAGRAGSGLVSVLGSAELMPALAAGAPEAMSVALASGVEPDAVLAAAADRDALVVGPGLGREEVTLAAVRAVVADCPRPLVLDADALNAFAGRAEELARRRVPAVLTPHPGEAARLLGIAVQEVQADRLAAVRRIAEITGAVVVLKGRGSLIAGPDGAVRICLRGGPELATAGSGDVLAGLLGGLLAQGVEPGPAAAAAVWMHARAGEIGSSAGAPPGLVAADLPELLPAVWRELAAGAAEALRDG